jgi:PAS domain S-box-containing protein
VSFPFDHDLLFSLIDCSIDGILAFDRECRYTFWSRAMERISGVSRVGVLGRNAFEVFPFLRDIGEDKYFHEVLAGRPAVSTNRPYIIPETSRQGFFEGHYFPLTVNGEITGGIGIIHDITRRKRNQELIREAYQRLAFHVENTPLAVIEWDNDFRVSRWSSSAERLFGWKQHEVLGKHVSDWKFVFTDDLEAVQQVTLRQRQGSERHGLLVNRNYRKDGSVIHCEWYNSVLNDDSGQLVSVLSLVLDVTPRKLAEEERGQLLVREREARGHAEDADRLKDEFLATLSHELRTPLTAVLGWASLMRSGDVPEAEFGRALEIIERNARSQARLIDDLLDVSRIITGNLYVDLRPLDLTSVVELASEAVRPAAQAKGIRLQLEFSGKRHVIKGDANRLRQIIWNLLMNAIKFTPRGGDVSVRVQSLGSSAKLIVEDNGEGISAEFLPYVFDRFRQAEGSISRKQGGLGLGLAVVRHLVELHGGSVSAASPGPNNGATFTVEFPLVMDSEALEAQTEDEGSDGQPAASKARLTGLRVLVVEDDDDSRSLVGTVLKLQGADVVFAASSAEALNVITAKPFDILISDIGMPEEDGYQFIRKLIEQRSSLSEKQPPAIALTGYATAVDRERALAAGYNTHLAKPVEPLDLVNAVAKLAGRD